MPASSSSLSINNLLHSSTPTGYNRTKRQYTRLFLLLTSLLLLTSHPLPSLLTSTAAIYTMHGGTYFSHKNIKWMSASVLSFVVSLYSLVLGVESDFVDENRAYELKTWLELKCRGVEIMWGGILLMCLGLTLKDRVEESLLLGAGSGGKKKKKLEEEKSE